MNIFKRPMFYGAIVCCVVSIMAIFSIKFIFLLLATISVLIYVVFKFKSYKYITVILAIILFSVSVLTETNKIEQINSLNKQTVKGEFLVIDEPKVFENFNLITLKNIDCRQLPENSKILVFDNNKNDLYFSDYIKATLKINSIDNNDEYFLYDYSNGIYATANLNDVEKTEKTNNIYKLFSNIRKYVKTTVLSFFDGDTAGLLLAITSGNKDIISDDLLSNVKETGISHVIVVSGMHLSIIMLAVFFIIDKIFYNKYIRAVISVLIVLLICGVCGYGMSIMRAAVMFLVSGFAPIFNRDKDLLSSLLTAIVIVLIVTPFAVVNISFLLSVLSTLSIVWIVPFYTNLLTSKFNIASKIKINILQMSLISIFAMIFTLPVTIKIFGYSSILAPVTNIVVTYPVTFALICNCIGLVLLSVPIINFLGQWFVYIAGLICDLIISMVNTLAELPITIAILPKSALLVSVLLIFAIIFYMYLYEYKLKTKEVI